MEMRAPERFVNLSNQDFLNLGLNDLAYIKSVEVEGSRQFVVHGANGAEIATFESLKRAVGVVRQNDLQPVWVQ